MDNKDSKDEMEDKIHARFPDTKTTQIVCRSGSITDVNDLRVCSFDTCMSVIVNADSDATTLKSVLVVTSLLKECGNDTAFITAVIRDEQNKEAAELAGEGYVEVLSYQDEMLSVVYADSPATRQACLHVLGDMEGNIGTGVLDFFAGALAGYESLPRVGSGEPLLTLSIDEALNRAAMEAMGDRRGAVLLSNYYTGEILCMYSSPSYDPLYGVDVSQARFDSVYLNRCLSVTYPPGSVFKLVTLAAAVEQLEDLDSRTFTCTGSRVVEGGTLNCHGTHGEQTVEEALANSCNCAFAELSLELGGETLAAYAEKLGLTGPVSVSGISTAAGSMETAPAGSLALAWTGVGQAKDMVCPAAMLRCVSAIANGGTAAELTILKGNYGGPAQRRCRREAEKHDELQCQFL